MVLDRRCFSFWDLNKHGWIIESGEFEIKVGGASYNLPLNAKIIFDNVKINHL